LTVRFWHCGHLFSSCLSKWVPSFLASSFFSSDLLRSRTSSLTPNPSFSSLVRALRCYRGPLHRDVSVCLKDKRAPPFSSCTFSKSLSLLSPCPSITPHRHLVPFQVPPCHLDFGCFPFDYYTSSPQICRAVRAVWSLPPIAAPCFILIHRCDRVPVFLPPPPLFLSSRSALKFMAFPFLASFSLSALSLTNPYPFC